MLILSIKADHRLDLDGENAVSIPPKDDPAPRSWTARVLSNVPINVKVGVDAEANHDNFYLNEFEEKYFAVNVGETLSIIANDIGEVWVSEVKRSA